MPTCTTNGDEGESTAIDGLESGDLPIELPRLLVDHTLKSRGMWQRVSTAARSLNLESQLG